MKRVEGGGRRRWTEGRGGGYLWPVRSLPPHSAPLPHRQRRGPTSRTTKRRGGGGAHRNTARQAMDGLWTEVCGQQKQSHDPGNNRHILNTPIIGRR